MEVNNRFDLFASLTLDEEPKQSFSIGINPSKQKQKQKDVQPTKNFWEIPEYVEKPIPCLVPLTTKLETSEPVTKEKTSRDMKKVKPIVDISPYEEQQDEVEIPPTVEVQYQPISYYPPQPYKFKQTSSSEHKIY